MSDEDTWVVEVGDWHFGPFTFEEGMAFLKDNPAGRMWPIWPAEEAEVRRAHVEAAQDAL